MLACMQCMHACVCAVRLPACLPACSTPESVVRAKEVLGMRNATALSVYCMNL